MTEKTKKEKIDPQWQQVETALQSGGNAGYVLAILEGEKILDNTAKEKGVQGQNLEHRLKKAASLISSPQEFSRVRTIKQKIIEEPGLTLSPDEVKYTLRAYWRAYEDLQNLPGKKKKHKPKMWRRLPFSFRAGIVSLFVAAIIITFLTDTAAGRTISETALTISRVITFWLLPMSVAIGLLYFLIKKLLKK